MDGNDVLYEAGKSPLRCGSPTMVKNSRWGKSRSGSVPLRLLNRKQIATTFLCSSHDTPYHVQTVESRVLFLEFTIHVPKP